MSNENWFSVKRYHDYLICLARIHLPLHLRGKLDPEDVVQEVLTRAYLGASQFRGAPDVEGAAWLRKILANYLSNVSRDLECNKRDARREKSLEGALEQSSARLRQFIAADESSPSHRASRHDLELRVAEAMEDLPVKQREALSLHYFQGRSLEAIGRDLGCTRDAVAGLLKRGLQNLRERLLPRDLNPENKSPE
jgi:RNA polymerase sigma-70 factor, ECF subfamily